MHKILLVDDDIQILELLVKILRSKNYKSAVATNGKKALEIVDQVKPDLILMDWNMPELSGIETIKALKEREESRDIPILMLTSQTGSQNLVKGFSAGAIDYIKKPIDMPELLIRIESALKLIDSYREIAQLKIKQIKHEAELQRLRNRELRSEIESKSREVYLSAIHLSEKNTVLRSIIDYVKKNNIDPTIKNDLIERIGKSIDLDRSLNLFKQKLENLNFDLIKRLKTKFDSLSDIELKICSMVHLGLSNKEIAALLFSSYRTVENHRYRITKKMSLASGKELKKLLEKVSKS